jgi:hypothetical protein
MIPHIEGNNIQGAIVGVGFLALFHYIMFLNPSSSYPGLFMKAKTVHGIHSIMSYNRTFNDL